MPLRLVTARARTRGKSPVEFQYQAVGRLQPRKVMDKDGNPILVDADSKVVKYEINKDEKTGKLSLPFENDSEGNPVAPEGTRFVEVDDVVTSGLSDNLQEVLDLFGALSEDERNKRTPLQMVIDSALDGYNYTSRKSAAPVTEQITEDELTPITAALVEHKILSEQDATTWRRTMTGTAKLMEVNRLTFAQSSPQYKKLIAAGWKPAETAA
jgi:hypothetical protein